MDTVNVNLSKGTNVVLLELDVAEVFKDSESVNHALRMLMDIAGKELKRNLTKKQNSDSQKLSFFARRLAWR